MTSLEFALRGVLQIIEPSTKAGAYVTVHYDAFSITAKGEPPMSFILPFDHLVRVQVSYVDSAGHPAKVDGAVVWDSSDLNIATVQTDIDDSTIAVITPTSGGNVGQVQISATADADLGEGVRELITLMNVEVVAGEAIAGTISPVSPPEPIPPA